MDSNIIVLFTGINGATANQLEFVVATMSSTNSAAMAVFWHNDTYRYTGTLIFHRNHAFLAMLLYHTGS